MHIGMIVGIGPAATDYYYRYLIKAFGLANRDLQLTMAHADSKTLLKNQAEGNNQAQVDIYVSLADRLQKCGVERLAVTSIAGHFCIRQFMVVSPIPVIDLLDTVRREVSRRGYKRLGLLGTRVVMETRFYGALEPAQVIAPVEMMSEVHDAYVAMATAGAATNEQREVFLQAGRLLTTEHGCESILLAGTDLGLVFNSAFDARFVTFDCAEVHAAAIADIAMSS
ncbi:MAG TPA: aspartate/glutamate racemase family protein [Terriglobales bacterium]|jgi:aspartate racemase